MNKQIQTYYKASSFFNGNGQPYIVPFHNSTQRKEDTKQNQVKVLAASKEQMNEIWWYPHFLKLITKGQKMGLVKNGIVHGSYGDMTQTNYSDLDVTLLLVENVLYSTEKMALLRKWLKFQFYPFMLSVDPLQHHGSFFLWETLIQNYPEVILPVVVYKYSWAVKPTNLEFSVQPFTPRSNEPLSVITCRRINSHAKYFFRKGYNMFAVKNFLSNLMLIPAFYYTDKKKPVHKADSFEPFYEKFGEVANPIKVASKLREAWPLTPTWVKDLTLLAQKQQSRSFPPFFIPRLIYFNQTVNHTLVKHILPSIASLCEAIETSF